LSTIKRFLRDTIIYGIAAVLPRAINILLVKLHTGTLASERYAENTIYFVFAAYFNAVLTYGMETAFFRFFTKEREKGRVISTAFISLLLTTGLFLLAMFTFSKEISPYLGFSDPLYLRILILVTALDTLVVIPYAYLRVNNRPLRFAFFKIFNVLVFALFNLYFLLYVPYALQNGAYVPGFLAESFYDYPLVLYIFVANLIASAVTFALLMPLVLRFKTSLDLKMLYRMLLYGLPIMVSSIAFVTNENLDKLLLNKLLGKEAMGVYAACYKLGVFMTLYIMAFKLGAEPFFFNQAQEKNARQTYARILSWFTVFGCLLMLLIVSFIDPFAGILLGKPEYYGALMIVPVILLANLFLGIYYNLSVWFKLTDKTRYGMYFSLIGAVITIALNLILIPRIGFMASAWATLAAYASMAIISYFFGKKYYEVPYRTFDMLLLIGLTVVLSYVSFNFFRGQYAVSVLVLLILAAFILWNQKSEIKQLWKT